MKIFCLQCKQDTNHEIMREYKRDYTPDDNPEMQISFAEGKWQILECKGCGEVTFRERWITSEDCPVPGGMDGQGSVKLYPQMRQDILLIKSFFNVPKVLRRIYREIIDCYNHDIYTLCAAGLRTIIEGICVEENIRSRKGESLQLMIKRLNERGLLTEQHSEILHEHRFLGNEAVHGLDQPSKEELKLAIQIIEHTLENIYELKDKAEELRRKKTLRKRQEGRPRAKRVLLTKQNDNLKKR